MLETDELLKQIFSRVGWYKPLNMDRQFACDIKREFKTGKLTENRKQKLLTDLGYTVAQQTMWTVKTIDSKK